MWDRPRLSMAAWEDARELLGLPRRPSDDEIFEHGVDNIEWDSDEGPPIEMVRLKRL